MKEKIMPILENRIFGESAEPGNIRRLASDLDELFNQEVEKRIAERMPPAMYGWICPRCGAVQSPYSTACHCLPPVRTWIGTSTELTEGGGE